MTENPKAKFHITYIPNEERNYVEHRSVNKIPSDLVHPTKSDTSSVSDSIFSERREEIAEDVPAPAEDVPAPPAPAPTLETVGMTTLHSRIKKVNEKGLWEASQCI